MTNCISCATEIPVKDIVSGNYKKIDGNTYCLNCAGRVTTSKATVQAASSARAGGSTKSGVHSTATREPGSGSSGSISRSSVAPSRAATKSSSSSSGIRASAAKRKQAEEEEEEGSGERHRYVKKEDPTFKIMSIVGAVAVLACAGIAGYVFTNKSNQDKAALEKFNNSLAAVNSIQKYMEQHPEDSANDEIEALINKNAPVVLHEHQGALTGYKTQLFERRQVAVRRKKFNDLFGMISTNIKDPAKSDDVAKAIVEVEATLLGPFADQQQKKDFASFKVLNDVAILEAKYNKAAEVRDKNPDNFPLICEAFTIAEESMSDRTKQLSNTKVAGADRAKELYQQVMGQVNQSADSWAHSDKYGFAVATPLNLLDPKEFAKQGEKGVRWSAGKGADYKYENGVMTAKGTNVIQEGKDIRAGLLFWAPGGTQMVVTPGTKDVMRNYEVTMKFKILKKGFTLLARHTGGFQRHAYPFVTPGAEEELKAQQKRAAAQGLTGAAGPSPAAQKKLDEKEDPFAMSSGSGAPPIDPNAFSVEEGKTYEVTERVYGNNIEIVARVQGSTEQPEPFRDTVTARYGGLAIQLLPGAEVAFESFSIKILN